MKSILLSVILMTAAPMAQACGVETDCDVPGGAYRIDVPDSTPTGAILFAHGYRGSANGTMRNARFRQMATDLGLAFVALDAGAGDDWNLPNAPGNSAGDGQANFDYVAAVVDDLKTKYGFDNDRVMITGFSAGGMLVWNLACARPDIAGGFAPVSGTFWLTPPDSCTTPAASIIHMHGEFYRGIGGFSEDYTRQGPGLDCEGQSNPAGDVLEFCAFEGGHTFSRNFVQDAWERFITLGQIGS